MNNNNLNIKNKLRLLHVVASPFPANQGTAAATCELISALAKRGHEIHVVTYYQGQEIELPNVKIHRIPRLGNPNKIFVGFNKLRPVLDFILIFKTLQVALKVKPHIIHSHHHEGIMATFLTRLLVKIPTLYHCQASMEQELPLYLRPKYLFRKLGYFLDVMAPKIADYNIAVSKDLADEIRNSSRECTYLPIIVDYKIFMNPNGFHPLDQYKLDDKKIVLYTGVVDQFQGIDNLLRAMKFVKEKVPGSMLVIATPISNRGQIEQHRDHIDKLGISDSVLFIENLPFKELPGLLSAADIAVIPRKHCPGFPIKLLNYIASNKPVVAMKGSAKVLVDEVNGMVADNYEDFGEKIVKLLRNPELGTIFAEKAKSILEDFTPETVSSRMEEIYFDLTNEK